jgi:hypothetical protein
MATAYLTMEDFVNNLRLLTRSGFQTQEVHKFLLGTLIEPDSLEDYVKFRTDRYSRNLIYKNELFELLVLCWDTGHRAPIHGHEGESCWARIERGSLKFTNYREISEQPLRLETTGAPVIGLPGYLDGPADIHEVENLVAFGRSAVSLHLYSRPYGECDIYSLEKGQKLRVKLDYDMISEKLSVRGTC